MNLQDIINDMKVSYESCKNMLSVDNRYTFNPSLSEQLEKIEVLQKLLDRDSKTTVVYLNSFMRDEDIDILEESLSKKFGNKVICLKPYVRNVAIFDPESFIEQKFEISKSSVERANGSKGE